MVPFQKAMNSIVALFFTNFMVFIFGSNALEYSNRWTVQINGDNYEADRLARKHGFVNHGKVGTTILRFSIG